MLADLALILSENKAVVLRLGPADALLTVKSPEIFAFGDTVGCKWIRMTPEERAEAVLGWIHKAAAYYRNTKIRETMPRQSVA